MSQHGTEPGPELPFKVVLTTNQPKPKMYSFTFSHLHAFVHTGVFVVVAVVLLETFLLPKQNLGGGERGESPYV